MSATRLRLTVRGATGELIEYEPTRLVVAGFTGSDPELVAAHIAELERAGVQPPPETPTFYELPVELLTTAPAIEVPGPKSSGEVEPVIHYVGGALYLGVGSDHTDRDLERTDIAAGKACCPKPVSTEVIPYEQARELWSRMTLRCRAGVGAEIYQDGRTAQVTPPEELLARYRERAADPAPVEDGLVLFMGTPPLAGDGLVFADRYGVELGFGDGRRAIEVAYNVLTQPAPAPRASKAGAR